MTSKKKTNITSRYVYVRSLAKFYDTDSGTLMPTHAFNQSESGYSSGLDANEYFKENGGKNVDGLGWMPCSAGKTPEKVIKAGRKLLANTYERPPVINPSSSVDIRLWREMLSHIVPDEREQNIYMDHMAATLQKPEKKIEWQILNYGEFRIGKDAVLRPMVVYLGSLVSEISNEMAKTGWGDTKAKKKMLIFGEVFQPGDRNFENNLKLFTASTATGVDTLNLKGGAIIQQPNLYAVYAMSNHRDCMHLSAGDARWFVIDSFDVKKRPLEEYKKYFEWLEKGGWKKVVAWLLARDLSNFSWGRLPYHTDAYMRLVEESRTETAAIIAERIDLKLTPCANDLVIGTDVSEWLKNNGCKVTQKALKKAMYELGCANLEQGLRKIDGKTNATKRLFAVRDIERYKAMSKRELYDALGNQVIRR